MGQPVLRLPGLISGMTVRALTRGQAACTSRMGWRRTSTIGALRNTRRRPLPPCWRPRGFTLHSCSCLGLVASVVPLQQHRAGDCLHCYKIHPTCEFLPVESQGKTTRWHEPQHAPRGARISPAGWPATSVQQSTTWTAIQRRASDLTHCRASCSVSLASRRPSSCQTSALAGASSASPPALSLSHAGPPACPVSPASSESPTSATPRPALSRGPHSCAPIWSKLSRS